MVAGADPLSPGALTFASPAASSYRETGGTNRVPHGTVDALLAKLIASGSAPSGLADASPAEAQRLLLDWLVAAKAAGQLRGYDFGPLTIDPSIGTKRYPVLLYPSSDLNVVDPSSTEPNDLGIETDAQVLDAALAERLLARRSGRLPTFGEWRRQHGIDAGAVLYPTTRAYWGWPYPPPATIPDAARFYRCLGMPLPTLQRIVVHSPVRLLVRDARGRLLGSTAHRRLAETLPGMFVIPARGPQIYEFPPARDRVTITATASGSASIAVYPPAGGLGTPALFTFRVHRGQTGAVSLTGRGLPAQLRFARHAYRAARGIALRIHGLPRVLPRHRTTFRLRVTDQFGSPVPGVLVSVTARGFATQTVTDGTGHANVTLIHVARPIQLRLQAPGYRTLIKRPR